MTPLTAPRSPIATLLRTGAIGLLAAALTHGPAAPHAQAQNPQPARTTVPAYPGIARNLDPGPIVSVDFPGGTIREYVATVKAAAGADHPVNVILPAEAADFPLPPISVRGVTAQTALEAIVATTVRRAGAAGPDISVIALGQPGDSTPTFAVLYSLPHAFRDPNRPLQLVPQTRVFSLADIVALPANFKGAEAASTPVNVVLTAVEAALGVGAEDEGPGALKFHKDSNLLIVRGTPAQLELVSSVLGELRKDATSRWVTAREQAAGEAANEHRQKQVQIELRLAEAELAAAEKRLAELRALHETGMATDGAVDQAVLEVHHKRARLDALLLEVNRQISDHTPQSTAQRLSDLQRQISQLAGELNKLRSERGSGR